MTALDLQQLDGFTVTRGGPELSYSDDAFEALLRTFVEETCAPDLWEAAIPKKRELFKKQLRDSDTVVVSQGDKLVGFGAIREWPSDGSTQDIYVELKSLIVSKSLRGGELARIISAMRERNAVDKGRRDGKGCILFFMTKQENVIKSAAKRGFTHVSAEDWVRETRPNTSLAEQAALAQEIEQILVLKIFRNDSNSLKNTHKVDEVRRGEGEKIKQQLA